MNEHFFNKKFTIIYWSILIGFIAVLILLSILLEPVLRLGFVPLFTISLYGFELPQLFFGTAIYFIVLIYLSENEKLKYLAFIIGAIAFLITFFWMFSYIFIIISN